MGSSFPLSSPGCSAGVAVAWCATSGGETGPRSADPRWMSRRSARTWRGSPRNRRSGRRAALLPRSRCPRRPARDGEPGVEGVGAAQVVDRGDGEVAARRPRCRHHPHRRAGDAGDDGGDVGAAAGAPPPGRRSRGHEPSQASGAPARRRASRSGSRPSAARPSTRPVRTRRTAPAVAVGEDVLGEEAAGVLVVDAHGVRDGARPGGVDLHDGQLGRDLRQEALEAAAVPVATTSPATDRDSSGATASASDRPGRRRRYDAVAALCAARSTTATMRPKNGMVKSSSARPIASSRPRRSDLAWWFTE